MTPPDGNLNHRRPYEVQHRDSKVSTPRFTRPAGQQASYLCYRRNTRDTAPAAADPLLHFPESRNQQDDDGEEFQPPQKH